MDRELTPIELKVIAEFDRVRPGLGQIVAMTIRNPNSGWAEIIALMDETSIKATSGTANNSFMYRRIGG